MRTQIKNPIHTPSATRRRAREQGFVLAIVFTIVVFVVGIFLWTALIRHLNQGRAIPLLSENKPIEMVILLICSILLFVVRQVKRIYYAALEISFGFVVGWNGFNMLETNGIGKWPIVLGAAYILVRGFDNLDVGLKSESKTELISGPQLPTVEELKIESAVVSDKFSNPACHDIQC
jgi:hypothetical protein